jgi:5-methylcytosine-specific restriction endonuclease McrA
MSGAYGCTNHVLFERLAEHLQTPWDGTRQHGFELAVALVGEVVPVVRVSRRKRSQAKTVAASFSASDAFLTTYEWRRLRMEVIKERGARCECCGATPVDGVVINVDHIKPRLKHPELALVKANLQVLCNICNHGKGNWDETDWRKESTPPVTDLSPCWTRRVQ